MQAKLRRMEVSNSQAVIENENLKNVLKFETDLRKARDAKESQLLGVASAAQDSSMKWSSEHIKRIMLQDKLVLDKTADLKKRMEERKANNVQDLLNAIQEDMDANQAEMKTKIPGAIKDFEKKFKEVSNQNKKLESEIDKVQSLLEKNQK